MPGIIDSLLRRFRGALGAGATIFLVILSVGVSPAIGQGVAPAMSGMPSGITSVPPAFNSPSGDIPPLLQAPTGDMPPLLTGSWSGGAPTPKPNQNGVPAHKPCVNCDVLVPPDFGSSGGLPGVSGGFEGVIVSVPKASGKNTKPCHGHACKTKKGSQNKGGGK